MKTQIKTPLTLLVGLAAALAPAAWGAEVGHKVVSAGAAAPVTAFEQAVASFREGLKPGKAELVGRFTGPCWLGAFGERNHGVWSIAIGADAGEPGGAGPTLAVLYPAEGSPSQVFFDGYDQDWVRLLSEPHDGRDADVPGFGAKRRLTEEQYAGLWEDLGRKYAAERQHWSVLQDEPAAGALSASYEARYTPRATVLVRRIGAAGGAASRFVALGWTGAEPSADLRGAAFVCAFSATPLPRPAASPSSSAAR